MQIYAWQVSVCLSVCEPHTNGVKLWNWTCIAVQRKWIYTEIFFTFVLINKDTNHENKTNSGFTNSTVLYASCPCWPPVTVYRRAIWELNGHDSRFWNPVPCELDLHDDRTWDPAPCELNYE